MKTTDLIPLILLELNDSDKYGFELTKSIESKSQGKIVIKQPTLYTILKKLEKSKFISSYWEDSDIGGKRHYYRITDNGRMQVSTLPDFSTLINNILHDDQGDMFESSANDIARTKDDNSVTVVETSEIKEEPKIEDKVISTPRVENNQSSFSIMDMIFNDQSSSDNESEKQENDQSENLDITYIEKDDSSIELTPELKENVVPSTEIFNENNLDNLTDNEINESNLDVLKPETNTDKFASNDSVSMFTEKQPELSNKYKEDLKTKSLNNLLIREKPTQIEEFNFQNVKYVDYTNFTTDEKHVRAKNISNRLSACVGFTCLYMLVMLLISTLCVKFSGTSPLFYITIIISCLSLIFYPSMFFAEKEKMRLNLVKNKYKPDFKKHIIVAIIIELVILVICFIVNIVMGNYNILKMFSIKNFENIYAEILISSTLFVDILLRYLYTKKFISME